MVVMCRWDICPVRDEKKCPVRDGQKPSVSL